MDRIPSPAPVRVPNRQEASGQPLPEEFPRIDQRSDGRVEQRADQRDGVRDRFGGRLVDDGRERMHTGSATINPYEIEDIALAYAPTKGTGSAERIAQEIDFNWKNYETYGKRDYAAEREHFNQGWRIVQHSDFPERFAPAGSEGPVIVKDMILMWRPMRLTVQARNEEVVRANRAMQVHRLKMQEAPDGQAPRMRPVIKTSREAIEIPE